MIWYNDVSNSDIIVSTRIRLARNLEGYPFPNRLPENLRAEITTKLKDAVLESNSAIAKNFSLHNMSEINLTDRRLLAEKHLISPAMAQHGFGSALISSDENMSLMFLEEDHLRIQLIMGGFKLDEAWDLASKLDDIVENEVTYAFSEDFGYLTACPTNTGTGLRASVMMHLPALTATNNMHRIIASASELGLTVRGIYGEGSKAHGNLYQISNQITLGVSEEEIISKLKNIVNQIKAHEEDARAKTRSSIPLQDKLCRSLGILKYARSISSAEAKSLISDVIWANSSDMLSKKIDIPLFALMVECERAGIEKTSKSNLSPEERDVKRAALIREYFKEE